MLTKPNILRLAAFTIAFAGALYYPIHEVVYYEHPRTPPREYRYKIVAAQLNDKNFEIRPKVSGRWQWVDYIFPRAEMANKMLLKLQPLNEPGAPELEYIDYPVSREYAEQILPEVYAACKSGNAELVIKRYPNGRWSIGDFLIHGKPVKEPKIRGVGGAK